MRTVSCLVLAACLLGGCLLNNINPTQQLNERVQQFSDATRWNRLDLAVQMVTPSYRDTFMQTHAAWGQAIEVADAELMQIQLAPDGNTATSTLAYSWYDLSAMTLARTVVRQTWDVRNGYQISKEEIVAGTPELLPPPPAPSEREDDAEATASSAATSTDAVASAR